MIPSTNILKYILLEMPIIIIDKLKIVILFIPQNSNIKHY